VICAYLDSLHDGKKLIPADGKARWQMLHLEGRLPIGHVALAGAIGWTIFRLSDRLGNWHTRWPNVAEWFAAFDQRPSMQVTKPR